MLVEKLQRICDCLETHAANQCVCIHQHIDTVTLSMTVVLCKWLHVWSSHNLTRNQRSEAHQLEGALCDVVCVMALKYVHVCRLLLA